MDWSAERTDKLSVRRRTGNDKNQLIKGHPEDESLYSKNKIDLVVSIPKLNSRWATIYWGERGRLWYICSNDIPWRRESLNETRKQSSNNDGIQVRALKREARCKELHRILEQGQRHLEAQKVVRVVAQPRREIWTQEGMSSWETKRGEQLPKWQMPYPEAKSQNPDPIHNGNEVSIFSEQNIRCLLREPP